MGPKCTMLHQNNRLHQAAQAAQLSVVYAWPEKPDWITIERKAVNQVPLDFVTCRGFICLLRPSVCDDAKHLEICITYGWIVQSCRASGTGFLLWFRRFQRFRSPQHPGITLLNEPIERLPCSKQRLIVFMILTAKFSIACSWKKASVSMSLFRRKGFLDHAQPANCQCNYWYSRKVWDYLGGLCKVRL